MVQHTFYIPEWGTQTCVVGTEWKEGTFNEKPYAFQVIYGISCKHINDGKDELIVSESFKIKQKVDLMVGQCIELVFDRFGRVEAVKPVKETGKI